MHLKNFEKTLFIFAVLCFLQIFLTVPNLHAQTRSLVQEEPERIALVIGNGEYISARKLENPVNDANDMTKVLEDLGFEVISGTNLDRREMIEKIREFGDRLLSTKGIGLFYYAGHGIQVRNKNYLIPVKAEIPREDEIDFAAVDLNLIMRKMASADNGLNIVILDACRNNPFARGWSRSADEGGLAQVTAPTGTFISYATAPNQTASDGRGENGLYTSKLLEFLKKPGLKIEETFKQVTIAVAEESGGKQIPWTSSSLRGDFYFNPQKEKVAEKKSVPQKQSTKNKTQNTNKQPTPAEKASWELVKESDDIEVLQLYIQEFPNGYYTEAAKFKIKIIEKNAWNLVENSEDNEKIQDFLNRFPDGEYASLARIMLKKLEAKVVKEEKTSAVIKAGTVRKNSLGIEFVWIPPGEFLMGSPANEKDRDEDEGPQRKVTIGKGFWLGKYEITQGQFQQIMGTNPSKYKKCGANCPVERVTWDEAKEFIKRLNEKDNDFVYALPTEAEWEYAARAGTTTRYSFGDSSKNLKKFGRQGKTSGTHPVGELLPNPWGLYDIYGNVREWVEDIYNEAGYRNLPTDGSANLTIGDRTKRVLRGGSWIYFSQYLRSANRFMNDPTDRDSGIGFRIVARQKIIYKIPLP